VRTFEIYDSILLEVSQKCACGTYHITLKRYVTTKLEVYDVLRYRQNTIELRPEKIS